MQNWTQADFVLSNGARLHYHRTGNGEKRPIVLVHGFSDNGACWTPVARALEAEYDVIMPDMRSHGLSDRFQPDEKVDMAADVAELIRGLSLGRPIVAGHSMGGGICYQLTVRYPELVSALILEDAPFMLPRPEPTPPPGDPADNPAVKWATTLPGKTMEQLLEENHRDHPTWPEELIIPMCEAKKQLDPTFIFRMVERIRSDQAIWQVTVQNITQPVLLFTANPALGAMVLPEAVAKVRELNPNIRIVHIPDAGHLIRFDRYEAFMDALWAFLKQIPA
jgi:pimeloyl-ACP methyl ester carboxylesterase